MLKKTSSLCCMFIGALFGTSLPNSALADVCPQIYEPVCALNWDRYGNACFARLDYSFPMQGGALIEMLDAHGEYIAFWSTNDAFIDEAFDILEGTLPQRVPSFNDLHYGSLCTEPHAFYPDPEDMEWADVTIELCDGTLGYIGENLHAWMQEVDQWCPWSSEIIGVWDYRN